MRDITEASRREPPKPRETGWSKGSDERGFVLVIVMILIAVLLLLGLAANRNMFTDIGIASNHKGNTSAFYAAEAMGEECYNQLLGFLQKNPLGGALPNGIANPAAPIIAAGNGTNYNFGHANNLANYVQALGAAVQVPSMDYPLLTATVQKYRIAATATDPNTGVANSVAMDVDSQFIAIFQFLIFYDGDLELNPGAAMNIGTAAQRGVIHTNGSFYTSPGATETIYSTVSATGEIIHARKQGDTQSNGSGTVSIENASGSFNTLASGSSTWNSSTHSWQANSNWASTEAQWNGNNTRNVESGDSSATLPLGLPNNQGQTDPEAIINQTGTGTMYSKAAVIITNGTAKDAAGNTLSTCYYNANHKNSNGTLKIDSGCAAGANQNSVTTATSANSVPDYREGKTAQTVDIDVHQFEQTPAGQYLASATPANGGTSGVLYATSTQGTSSSTFDAIRLINGANISNPLTVATNLPAYVQGDFNTANGTSGYPPAAAIMSDATTILSNSWSSSYTTSTGLSSRGASNTTINADIMTGNQATTVRSDGSQGYGGGVHNLTRFLEDWSGHSFTFGGSLVCLWQSQVASGRYQNPGGYYQVPSRNFTFNPFNGQMPPGTPYVSKVSKSSWRHF